LIHYPPTVQLSTLVNSLKGVSARYLRQEFPDHIQKYLWGNHFWSPSYFAASAGGAPLAIVAEYITNQQRPEPTQEATPLRAIAQYRISFLPALKGQASSD
uniref:IS200/IS605 family transposase n=1 Tax=Rhodococcus koreensis TaxID=99653 RepID=UPI0021000AA1